jgi:hypothetical protein
MSQLDRSPHGSATSADLESTYAAERQRMGQRAGILAAVVAALVLLGGAFVFYPRGSAQVASTDVPMDSGMDGPSAGGTSATTSTGVQGETGLTADPVNSDPPEGAPDPEPGQEEPVQTEPTTIPDTTDTPESDGGAESTPVPDERFPQTKSSRIEEMWVRGLSDDDLRYAVNEMAARVGYDFRDPEIEAHFATKAWYQRVDGRQDPLPYFDETERANWDLLVVERERRKASE